MKVEVNISIDDISQTTYDDILYLLRRKYGEKAYYNDWKIIAMREEE